MQRRLFIVIGIVLVVLALAVIGFVLLGQGGGLSLGPSEPEAAPETIGLEPTPIPTVQVIIARQPIGRGDEFIPGALGRTDFPAPNVPPDAITNEAETIGKIANIEIAQGQIILRSYLRDLTAGSTGEAAFEIPPGRVMVPFPIDRQSGVAYAVQAGDFVDVLMTVSFVDFDPEFQTILPNKFSFVESSTDDNGNVRINLGQEIQRGRLAIENENFPGIEFPSEEQRPRRVAQLTVQSAKVIRVGVWGDYDQQPTTPPEEGVPAPTPAPPDIISIAVTPQDALVLLWARQTRARMELALRAAGDENGLHNTEAVTLQYMLTRFNIAVPPKLEFGIEKSDDFPTPTPVVVPQTQGQ